MTRLLLECISILQELIDQRLAIATAHSQEQLRAKGNQLKVPEQTPTAAITDTAGGGGRKRDTDDLMDDEQNSLDPETHVPVSRLTIAVLQKFFMDNGMAEEAVNSLPKGKEQLLYCISWSIPQGLAIVVSVLQWPEKTKHLETKMAKLVGLVSGALAWSSDCVMQMDPTTPVAARPNPQTATPANNEGVYVLGLEDVYLRIESAEKRASRNMQPTKKQALTDSPNVVEVSAGGAATLGPPTIFYCHRGPLYQRLCGCGLIITMVVLGDSEPVSASSEMAARSPNSDDLLKSFDEWVDTVDPRIRECIQGQLKQLEEQTRAIENFTALADYLSTKFHDLCERHDHQRDDENPCQPLQGPRDQQSQCLPEPNPCEYEELAFRVNRSLRRVWEMYAESVGYQPIALERFSPDLHVKFQEYSASTSARSNRALLRFNGGWEHMLKAVLGMNFSVSVSAFAFPSSHFSAFSRECLEVGASPLSHAELLAEGIGGTPAGVTPGFFIRTDLFPTPQASFFEVVHDAIMSDAPFRLVVASCCGASAAWGSWMDQWCQEGRAHLLARLPTLKMRRYGGMREQWVWDEYSWEFFVIES